MASSADILRARIANGRKKAQAIKSGKAKRKASSDSSKTTRKVAEKKETKKKINDSEKTSSKKAKAKSVQVPKAEAEPKETKKAGVRRVKDRDVGGDDLRPVERDVLILVNKKAAPVTIREIAEMMFGGNGTVVPAEGANSTRTIRNAVRKPYSLELVSVNNSVVKLRKKGKDLVASLASNGGKKVKNEQTVPKTRITIRDRTATLEESSKAAAA